MINIHLMEYIEIVQSAQSIAELLDSAARFAKLQGFDYFAYGHRSHTPFSAHPIMHNNYPASWQEIYKKQEYVYQDPLVQHAIRSSVPLIWTAQDTYAVVPHFLEDLMAFDMKSGWCQSTRSTSGVSLLTLARSDTNALHSEISTPSLLWFTQVFNNALEKLISSSPLVDNEVQLTSREIDVMRWTADGKTSHEIAVILGISERTVNFHLNNVMAKLNANNRISATVKAISLGLV